MNPPHSLLNATLTSSTFTSRRHDHKPCVIKCPLFCARFCHTDHSGGSVGYLGYHIPRFMDCSARVLNLSSHVATEPCPCPCLNWHHSAFAAGTTNFRELQKSKWWWCIYSLFTHMAFRRHCKFGWSVAHFLRQGSHLLSRAAYDIWLLLLKIADPICRCHKVRSALYCYHSRHILLPCRYYYNIPDFLLQVCQCAKDSCQRSTASISLKQRRRPHPTIVFPPQKLGCKLPSQAFWNYT